MAFSIGTLLDQLEKKTRNRRNKEQGDGTIYIHSIHILYSQTLVSIDVPDWIRVFSVSISFKGVEGVWSTDSKYEKYERAEIEINRVPLGLSWARHGALDDWPRFRRWRWYLCEGAQGCPKDAWLQVFMVPKVVFVFSFEMKLLLSRNLNFYIWIIEIFLRNKRCGEIVGSSGVECADSILCLDFFLSLSLSLVAELFDRLNMMKQQTNLEHQRTVKPPNKKSRL